jgi:hypothetical protein
MTFDATEDLNKLARKWFNPTGIAHSPLPWGKPKER